MKDLFILSYALLGGLIVLQAMVLNRVLLEVLRLRRSYISFLDKLKDKVKEILAEGLPKGAAAPEFQASLLWTGELINTSHLKGHSSILMFVDPGVSSPFYSQIPFAMHSMWHETDGHLYIVCNGREELCRTFINESLVAEFGGHKIPVIVDEEGAIARYFLIKDYPRAVALDEDARVLRNGKPVPNE